MSVKCEQAILYFVKYPAPGKVKTRLARDIGNERAAQLYKEIAQKNYKVLRSVLLTDLIVAFDPPGQDQAFKEWLPGADQYFAQNGEGLGSRLVNSSRRAFDQGYGKVLVIGSDILELTRGIVEQGFAELNKADVVLGPAQDGGYYLIGTRALQPALFDGIAWSTDQVYSQTCHAAQCLRLTYRTLLPLEDLDEIKTGGQA